MVNVAGRSRGCLTCRRRRIKCDEARPSCAKCAAAKIDCEGYPEKGFIQVDFSLKRDGRGKSLASKPKHHYPSRPKKARDVDQDDASTASSSASSSSAANVEHESSSSLSLSSTTSPNSAFSFSDAPAVTTIPGAIPPSGFLDLICQSFTSENLLRGVPNPEFLFPSHGGPSIELPIQALSNIYFGITHQDRTSTSLARSRYAKSVRSLNEVLQDDGVPDVQTMVAVFTLGLFEFVSPSQSTGWVWHYMGLAALFERIGPERVVTTPTLRDMLDISLPMIAMAAMVTRREIALTRPEWKKAIWAADITKTRIGYFSTALIEIMIDTPHMLIVHDVAFRQEGMGPGFKESMEIGESMQRRLDAWQAKWSAEMAFSLRRCPADLIPPPLDPDTGQPCWDSALTFSGIMPANQLTRFWAIKLTVATLLRRMYEREAKVQGRTADTTAQTQIALDSAVNICRSVEFHLLEHQQGVGSFMMLFPLRVAHRVFPESDPRRSWVEMVMEIISARRGSWGSAREILEVGASYPEKER